MVAVERDLPVVVAAPSADAIPLALRRHGGSPRQVLALTLIGTLVLAMFASRDLSSWLDRMGAGPLLAPLQHAAAGWDRIMQRAGLGSIEAEMREAVRHLLDWQW
ncbi:MAG: hypothetical protein ACM3JG_04760 [Thiohalocapsa sp.]